MSFIRRRPRGASLTFAAVAAASLLVWQSSHAAFSASTSNPDNTWATGTVVLSDSKGGPSAGTALWSSESDLTPGATGTRCIRVTYSGSLPAAVRMYVAGGDLTGTGLGSFLRFTVDEGLDGTDESCADFGGSVARLYNSGPTTSPDGTSSTATLARFADPGLHQDFASGVGTWTPAGGVPESRTYRVTWTVLDDNRAQGRTATAAFTWEAQNT